MSIPVPEPQYFWIKSGDTWPPLDATLYDADGNAVDLTGGTVVLNMRPQAGGSLTIAAGAVTLTDASAGEVSYSWGTADTAAAGVFVAEFKFTHGGTIGHFPNANNIIVTITPSIG